MDHNQRRYAIGRVATIVAGAIAFLACLQYAMSVLDLGQIAWFIAIHVAAMLLMAAHAVRGRGNVVSGRQHRRAVLFSAATFVLVAGLEACGSAPLRSDNLLYMPLWATYIVLLVAWVIRPLEEVFRVWSDSGE